ncbi:MAG: hypothetical protein C0605_13050 [Hyphomicrobiales bacterium]|nr:MAG: hypothetical protein C0605_13050 [Hyphomicrobiales bacterium]
MKTITTTAFALALLLGATGAQAGTQIFFDDFNGDKLADHWEVINEDADAYIVEDGALLSIATGGGGLSTGKVANIFRLKQKLPKGDWVASIKYTMPYQTGRETPFFGLYGDKDNYITGHANAWSYYEHTRGSRLFLSSNKTLKGKNTSFSRVIWGGAGGKPFTAEEAPNPFVLKITKKGRSYTASVQFRQGAESTEVEDAAITVLREPGSLAFGIYQSTKVKGETPISVDWVKIESAD